MDAEHPEVRNLLRRCMVARIATLSSNRRPSVNPLYFTVINSRIYLVTADWTLAARNVRANPQVSVLFEREGDEAARWMLRVTGQAQVRTDASVMRPCNLQVALKYIISPGGLLDTWRHRHRTRAQRLYRAGSQKKGQACVIEVTPERFELLEKSGD
jgi:hypothetical protein